MQKQNAVEEPLALVRGEKVRDASTSLSMTKSVSNPLLVGPASATVLLIRAQILDPGIAHYRNDRRVRSEPFGDPQRGNDVGSR